MTVKEQVKSELSRIPGRYCSGSSMAQKIGVSRSAVWKAIQELRAEKIQIESHRRFGYRLGGDTDLITRDAIDQYLKTRELGRELLVLDETDSTNTYLKKLAREGCGHGVTVLAYQQTGGRGQSGRSFYSPVETGLYFSVLVRREIEADAAQRLTICAAVAVARAIDWLYGTRVQIKWVNDLYLGGKKICGILTEGILSCERSCLEYAVIGIGVNVRRTKEFFPPELLETVSSIEEARGGRKKISRNRIAAEILNQLEPLLDDPQADSILAEYRNRSILKGRKVQLEQNGNRFCVRVLDVDRRGRLVIEDDQGRKRALVSADRVILLEDTE